MNRSLEREIHDANIELHRIEAENYELFHSEIFNRAEQKRIVATLERIDRQLETTSRKALDFGAGTGNLTGKLLAHGYNVTAVDISKEMCKLLEKRYQHFTEMNRFKIVNSGIERVDFDREEFDLIACYSVLHHLPDYIAVIRRLSFFLRKKGIMYLDHEESPYFWHARESRRYDRKIDYVYSRSVKFYNYNMLKQILHWRGVEIPPLDYSLADFWINERHHLDHEKIRKVLQEEKFAYYTREDYHAIQTRFFNPIFWIHKLLCKPDYSLWIAKK